MSEAAIQFAETAALYALMNEDFTRLGELLDGMLDGELEQLAEYCDDLAEFARDAAASKRRKRQS